MKKEQKVLFDNNPYRLEEYLDKGWSVVNMIKAEDKTGTVCFLLEREISDAKVSVSLKERNEKLERQVALLADTVTRIADWKTYLENGNTPQSIATQTLKLL